MQSFQISTPWGLHYGTVECFECARSLFTELVKRGTLHRIENEPLRRVIKNCRAAPTHWKMTLVDALPKNSQPHLRLPVSPCSCAERADLLAPQAPESHGEPVEPDTAPLPLPVPAEASEAVVARSAPLTEGPARSTPTKSELWRQLTDEQRSGLKWNEFQRLSLSQIQDLLNERG